MTAKAESGTHMQADTNRANASCPNKPAPAVDGLLGVAAP